MTLISFPVFTCGVICSPCSGCPMSEWSAWSDCSCVSQYQQRFRAPLISASGGQHCTDLQRQSRPCKPDNCTGDHCLIPQYFTEWLPYQITFLHHKHYKKTMHIIYSVQHAHLKVRFAWHKNNSPQVFMYMFMVIACFVQTE